MFLTVDKKEVLTELSDILLSHEVNGHILIDSIEWKKEDIIELISICLEDNTFRWNGEWFRQNDGVFMDNSMSPVLAEIAARIRERVVLPRLSIKPKLFGRFVDDMVLVGPPAVGKEFAEIWNESGIKTTSGKHKIATVWLSNQFSAGKVVHWTSAQHYNVKKGIYWGGIDRIKAANSGPIALDDGINEWNGFFINSGYPPHIIKNWGNEWIERRKNPIQKPTEKYLASVPNNANSAEFVKMFQDEGIISTHFRNSLFKTLQSRPETGHEPGVGVYQIPCKTCDKIYIGQTGRALNIRIKEHMKKKC
uniref:GIY-YIG domain-containing protein n=1 Tax=Strigamia maritima TaxID=126957 RepID=T1IJ03_STRMM